MLTPSPEIAIALLDDIAEVNADSTDAASLGHPRVALDLPVLHLDRATHRVDDTRNSTIAPSPVRFTTRPL